MVTLALIVYRMSDRLTPDGVARYVVRIVLSCWTVYSFLVYLTLFPTYTIDDTSLHAHFIVITLTIPWSDVTQVQWIRFSYHVVYVKNNKWIKALSFSSLMLGQSLGLVIGLKDRTRLFNEIRRRASQAQGREIPVIGMTQD